MPAGTKPIRRPSSELRHERPPCPTLKACCPSWTKPELPGLEDTGPAARNSIRAQLFRLQVRAQRTGKAKLERLADRTLDAFEQLADALDKLEQADRDAARVAELRTELAQLTGRSSSDAGLIREWARAEGIHVPARGRVPADIVEQYRQAQRNA